MDRTTPINTSDSQKWSFPLQRYLEEREDWTPHFPAKARVRNRRVLETIAQADTTWPPCNETRPDRLSESHVSASKEHEPATVQLANVASQRASSSLTSSVRRDSARGRQGDNSSECDCYRCTEGLSRKDTSHSSGSPSHEIGIWKTSAYQKHQITVSLMRDVYVIFDSEWKHCLRTLAGSASNETNEQSQETWQSASSVPLSRINKRRAPDRESSPPDEDNRKGKRRPRPEHGPDDGRSYGCPFYKNNPRRYSPMNDAKYRPCIGPGFKTISHLKQHLKRNHSPPTYQCLRCWTVTSNRADLRTHQTADERCQIQLPPLSDGANQDKIELIHRRRGISWEGIYEILFPGEVIPSPYHEPCREPTDLSGQDLAPSQELRDFEAYSRGVLREVVEGLLQDEMATLMTQIEEHVRPHLVEIVRTTLATLLHNYRLDNSRASLPLGTPSESHVPEPFPSSQIDTQTPRLQDTTNTADAETTDDLTEPFQDPITPIAAANLSTPEPSHDHGSFEGDPSISADPCSTNLSSTCDCLCHQNSSPMLTVHGERSCEKCLWMHIDSHNFDFSSFEEEVFCGKFTE